MRLLSDEVRVRVAEDGADPQRLDELAGFLRAELLQLDVDDVRPLTTGPAPPGSRAIDVIAIGGLLVKLGQSAGGLVSVVSAVRRWLARSGEPTRTVRLEVGGDTLELSAASAAEQERLVALFIARHGPADDLEKSAGEGAAWPSGESP